MSNVSSQFLLSSRPDPVTGHAGLRRKGFRITQSDLTAIVARHPAREQLISEAAYHHAEARGFEPGHELEDWLTAEAEVDARLSGEGRAY